MSGLCGFVLFNNNVSFLSYLLTLTPSLNRFAELPVTLVREFGCHVGIHVKRVGFQLRYIRYTFNK